MLIKTFLVVYIEKVANPSVCSFLIYDYFSLFQFFQVNKFG